MSNNQNATTMLNNQTTKNCEFCGHEFAAIRPTAKFCCNSCRTKANVLRRENEKIEAQKVIEQAEIAELKSKASEDRKIKKAEKTAASAEKQRLDEQMLQDQKDKEAADLAEKQRIDDEANEQLRLKEEADEKQRKADKERKDKADMQRIADEVDANIKNAIVVSGIAVGIFNLFENRIENQQKKSTEIDFQTKTNSVSIIENSIPPLTNFTLGNAQFQGSFPSYGYTSNLGSYQTQAIMTLPGNLHTSALQHKPGNTSLPAKPPPGFISSW